MSKIFKVKNPMSGKFFNLTGKKFGALTVLERSGVNDKNNRVQWVCLCDCGNTCLAVTHYLNSGKTTSCGCRINNKGSKSAIWTGYEEIAGTVWGHIINGANHRNISFDLTIEDAWELFLNQERKCALTNLPLSFSKTQMKFGNDSRSYRTASLDRKDSKLGYIKENVQWLHKDINLMKNKFDETYFINMCKLIVKNHANKI